MEVGAGNRLRAANGERLAYDERLRLCRREGPAGTTEYRYDALDRLIEVERNGERWSASYDPLCRRVSKTWRGRTTTYCWDDFRLAAEHLPDGTQRIYVYADLEALVPLMFVEYPSPDAEPSSGRAYHVFTDQVGAPLCVQDEQGHVVWRARMRPFGAIEVEASSTVALDLRFPGHLHDPETGLHLNRFRYYDPRLGRYLQSDPLGVVGGLNVYQYCPSPLSTVDLDGLMQSCRGSSSSSAASTSGSPPSEGIDHQPSWWSCLLSPFSCGSWTRHHDLELRPLDAVPEAPAPAPRFPRSSRPIVSVGQGGTNVAVRVGDEVLNTGTTRCGLVVARGANGIGVYHWPFMSNYSEYHRRFREQVEERVGPLSRIDIFTNRIPEDQTDDYFATAAAIHYRYRVPTSHHAHTLEGNLDPHVYVGEDGYETLWPTEEIWRFPA